PHLLSSCDDSQLLSILNRGGDGRMKPKLLLGIVVFAQLISAASGSAAQSGIAGDGSCFGTVRDSGNAPLSGVKVSAVNIATNVRLESRMLPTGLFGLPFLPAGIYRIHAELPGFQTIIRVEPIVRGPSNVNFWLAVAPNRDDTPANLGVITGTVRGFDNVSVPRATITLRNGTTG